MLHFASVKECKAYLRSKSAVVVRQKDEESGVDALVLDTKETLKLTALPVSTSALTLPSRAGVTMKGVDTENKGRKVKKKEEKEKRKKEDKKMKRKLEAQENSTAKKNKKEASVVSTGSLLLNGLSSGRGDRKLKAV